ncbi:MAG: 4'-phosphopantetheinyl transferase superfamily protein [Lawsonibacter sp.]|nr:4'-phosphopantetheinyl transferase superfamily protein [Lawsonibacter sp.]
MVVYGARHPRARSVSRALLALAARETWGLEALPELETGERGKPFFPENPERQFNLSHSGELLVCALDGAPVGVDIQQERAVRDSLAVRVCGGGEREWLRRRGDSPQAFALLWSLKESRCKQSGEGLRLPVSGLRVPLPEGGGRRLELDGLYFYMRTGPGWALSLCGTGEWDGEIRWRELE